MQLLISISPGPALAFPHRNNVSLWSVSVRLYWHDSSSHLASAYPTKLVPWEQGHTGHAHLAKTKGILLVHLTFPFCFPLEISIFHFFSILAFLFILSLSPPSAPHTQQCDTHRKTFVTALTFYPATTNSWKERRVTVVKNPYLSNRAIAK